ncbi:hypothetical protein RUM44_003035 [Polyplax serrata]|uniref:Phosducin domain-containing protein n=1 Tax=Polyplax serrata TaxID=468196 RepID=A0ABR1AXE1_POLSC
MSTLEDKILGEKREYYCSSSESENEGSGDEADTPKTIEVHDTGPPPLNPSDGGCSTNTGPKGVIKDWQQFKQIEAEQRLERERERMALIQRLAFTCRSELDKEKEEDPELSDLLEDPFLLEYSRKKMEEMLGQVSKTPKFGDVQTLLTGEQFLDAIDKECKGVTVLIHIYEEKVAECRTMNSCLSELSQDFPQVKFCKLLASNVGVSKHFKVSGVPALLVYKNGALIGNFVKITEELGTDFSTNDVENFLVENGMLVDRSFVAPCIRQSEINKDDEVD